MYTNVFIFWATIALLFDKCAFSKLLSTHKFTNDRNRAKQRDVAFSNPYHSHHKSKFPESKEFQSTKYFQNEKQPVGLKKECAIMYRNQEPIGILQPYKDSFKLLPVGGSKLVVEMEEDDQKSDSYADLLGQDYLPFADEKREVKDRFFDDKYPSIFTQFKINSRLASASDLDKENKQQAIVKRDSQPKATEDLQVEDQLQDILNDMGLIEDNEQEEEKREVLYEDENLEHGTNRISLVKYEERIKRDDDKSTRVRVEQSSKQPSSTTSNCFRGKREKPAVVQNLEKSGELQVTGNKSPLYQSNSKITNYEKRVQRDIQEKIRALKEQVKKEIKALKKDKMLRKKRQIISSNTLIEAESGSLDPNMNSEEKLEPHIRRRRDVQFADDFTNSKFKIRKLKQLESDTKLAIKEGEDDKDEQYKSDEKEDIDGIKEKQLEVDNKIRVKRELQDLDYTEENQFNKNHNKREIQDVDDNDENDAQFVDSKVGCGEGCGNSNGNNNNDNTNCNMCNNNNNNNQNSQGQGCGTSCGTFGQNSHVPIADFEGENYEDEEINAILRRTRLNDKRLDGALSKRRVYIATINDNHDDYEDNYPMLMKRNAEDAEEVEDETEDNKWQSGNYYLDLHPRIYKLTPFNEDKLYRRKRQSFQELTAQHGGEVAQKHLLAVRARSMLQPVARRRRRVLKQPQQAQKLIDMSDEDLFGALPQSFEGELARYKRVKRRTKIKR